MNITEIEYAPFKNYTGGSGGIEGTAVKQAVLEPRPFDIDVPEPDIRKAQSFDDNVGKLGTRQIQRGTRSLRLLHLDILDKRLCPGARVRHWPGLIGLVKPGDDLRSALQVRLFLLLR